MPKIKEKPIIYLDREEIIKMIDTINTGEGMTERQKKYVENTRVRDLSIIMLLLGTGIRESELVGMDMEDVDLEQQAFVVTRKGGNQMILYFNESIRDALAVKSAPSAGSWCTFPAARICAARSAFRCTRNPSGGPFLPVP